MLIAANGVAWTDFRRIMRFVYFESLKPDGTLEPQMISSDDFHIVRPLSAGEIAFAEKLRIGFFGDEPFRELGAYESMKWHQTDIGRAFRHAATDGHIVSHHAAQSVLKTVDGRKYALPQTVSELALSQPDLLVLNGDPEARAVDEATVVLGRPQLEQGKQLLLEFKRL
jgi:hypothetical protein